LSVAKIGSSNASRCKRSRRSTMTLDPRDATRLEDILIFAKRAQSYAGSLTADDLKLDPKTQDAVARCFEVIGEAARHVSAECKAKHASIPWPFMVGMRHRIIHEYSQVDYALVMATIRNQLPTLIKQIDAIISREAP
jgi:uncharacterized protein with HEPN domain